MIRFLNISRIKFSTYWFEKQIGNSDFITLGVLSSWALTIVWPIWPINPVNNVPTFDQNDKIFILNISIFLLWLQIFGFISQFWNVFFRSVFLSFGFPSWFIFLASTDRNTLVVFNLDISGFGFAPFLKIYEYHSCPFSSSNLTRSRNYSQNILLQI